MSNGTLESPIGIDAKAFETDTTQEIPLKFQCRSVRLLLEELAVSGMGASHPHSVYQGNGMTLKQS